MMKSSRRKQTKPIRVYETAEQEQSVTARPTGEDYTNGQAERQEENGEDRDEDMPIDMHVAIITCSKCPETFPTREDLAQHVNLMHVTEHVTDKVDEASYPTAYHRLGSEFQQENKYISNGHAEIENTPPRENAPSDQNDTEAKDQNGDSSAKPDGTRIFHPDAYCELCDREFCNKYFLKTHKANKHGIYENAPSPFGINSAPQGMILPQEPAVPLSFKVEPVPSPAPPPPPPPPPPPKIETAVLASFKLEATSKPETPVTPVQTKPAVSDGKNSTSQSASGSASQPDMEDYCEICQKHFCNKYYLKKHKQDVHGIVPENSSSSSTTKRSRPSIDVPSTTSTVTSSHMILPQTMASMAGLPSMPNMPGVMVLNPFMPPVAIIPAQSLLPQQQIHQPPSAIVSQPLSVSSHPDTHTTTNPVSTVITSALTSALTATSGQPTSSMPNDALRSIGVLNAEAYCELCRKEFCNKYFLKIHKANKHGIYTDEFPRPFFSPSMDALENMMLIPAKIPKEVKVEPGTQITSSPPTASNSDSYVTFCNLCNKEFSSKYSYKIHRMNVHGMLNENLLEPALPDGTENTYQKLDPAFMSSSEGLLKVAAEAHAAASAASNNNASTIFGNMIAAKLADRVVCEICNKELCNKYFLKAHKLRIHGIDTTPQEKAAEAAAAAAATAAASASITSTAKTPSASPGLKTPPSVTPNLDSKESSIITAEMITQDILQRSQSLNLNKKRDLSNLPPGSPSEKPSSDELVKLGIDPDAYCEICKKEFCSKYFLRTHKLNIHGIRTDKTESEPREKSPLTPKNAILMSAPDMSSVNTRMSNFMNFNNSSTVGGCSIGTMLGLSAVAGHINSNMLSMSSSSSAMGFGSGSVSSSVGNLSGNGKSNSNGPTDTGNSTGNGGKGSSSSSGGKGNGGKEKEGFERHTWRWKEPVNSSRVSCELCNKELCNKYFLRTHKLNKHGIIPSDKSLSPSVSSSPAPSDCETASNASSQPDLSISEKGGQTPVLQTSKTENQSPRPSTVSEKSSEKTTNSAKPTDLLKIKNEEEMSLNNRYFDQYSEICNLCDRRFKSSRWLKAHILKDHAGWPMMDMMDMRVQPRGPVLNFSAPDPKSCQVCGLVFPSELSMQLHLIQEHNAQVTLKTEEQQNGNEDSSPPSAFSYGLGFRKRVFRADKLKLYTCLFCDYKTKWLSNMTSHERKVHNLVKNNSNVGTCKLCPKSFPSELLLSRHVEKQHGDPLDISSSGSRMTKKMKRFKCSICEEKFHSRVQCHKHLREVHIRRKKNFALNNKVPRSKFSCSVCSFSTRYPQQLRRHLTWCHGNAATLPTDHLQKWNHDLDMRDESETLQEEIPLLHQVHAEAVVNSVNDSMVVQCFKLAVSAPDSAFLPSVAHMPVRQWVSEPTAVTFVLTPVNP